MTFEEAITRVRECFEAIDGEFAGSREESEEIMAEMEEVIAALRSGK